MPVAACYNLERNLQCTIESALKTDELHKMEYFGCDLPLRSYIDSAVPRIQYRKGTTAS